MEDKFEMEKDYLTNLPNRKSLYQYYDTFSKNSAIHAIFLDVDNFKRVNDLYGHSMGDKLLICMADFLCSSISGFISRIGGDEFVVLIDGKLSSDNIIIMVQKLINDFKDIDFRKDILSLISLSVGIILQQSVSQQLDDILSKCDAAMYQSKYNGKNQYTVYKENDRNFEIRRNVEAQMEKALENKEFIVYLQPKVNMISSALYGAEALSRWRYEGEEIRLPNYYISIFEKNGFIAKLDMYMFEEVCKLKASWRGLKYEHIPVSVNMSRLHSYNKDFPDTIEAIARKYEVPLEELELEITETTFIKDSAELINMINILKNKGFKVSIDDFGSGFSALYLLKDLPVDTIKIDRTFLQNSASDKRGRKVLRNILALCKDLKMDVITEGIETKEQADFIMRCGCQIAQGFYYSKPLNIDDFNKFAVSCLGNVIENYTFRLNGNLKSEDGSKEGIISGKGLIYEQGIFTDSKSMFFPGGELKENVVYIPPETIINDSFTLSLWIKPSKLHLWDSALYVNFESGFCSILPLAWEGHSDFRIRDSRGINGWYDISGCQVQPDTWTHFVATYNAKTEKAIAFINGEVVDVLENVPTNRYVKCIILGGDIYQPSFEGNLCELVIYNEAKDYDFVRNLHQSYIDNEKFIGFPRIDDKI